MRSQLIAAMLLSSLTGCIFGPGPHWGHHHRGHGDEPDGPDDPDQGPGGGGGWGGSDDGGDDGGPDGEAPASTFESGSYAAVSLQILPEGVGRDLDGDGYADNNLPVALAALSAAVGGERGWDPGDELSRLVDEGLMVPLMTAHNDQDGLTIALLSGFVDDNGALVVHSLSYGDDGSPRSLLEGAFCTQDSFDAGPDDIFLPVRVDSDAGVVDLLLPLELGGLAGVLNSSGGSTTLSGVLPLDGLIDLVLMPYLGDDGLDLDGDGDADISTREVLALVEELASDPDLVDIVLDDGTRGISAGLSLVWEAERF